MGLPVSLAQVVLEIDGVPREWTTHVHRQTGEIVVLPDELDDAIESLAEDFDRVRGDPGFVTLPGRDGRDDYGVMERFCESVADERKRERLEDAIQGKGAFGRFKAMVDRLGLRDEWFAYRHAALARDMRAFLTIEGIAFTDDVGPTAVR